MKIGILGNGSVGRKLGALCSAGGHELRIGVRHPAAAASSALAVVRAHEAAAESEVLILAVPYSACATLLPELAPSLAGKIIIDSTNPLQPDWSPLSLGPENSAAEEIARLLPQSRVAKAFNTIFADIMEPARLDRAGRRVTAFVCSDDLGARTCALGLAQDCGFSPLDAGPLSSARYLEAMAHLNIRLAVSLGGGTNAAFLYDRASA